MFQLLLLLRKTTLLTLHKDDTYTDTENKKKIHKEVNQRKEEEEPVEVDLRQDPPLRLF